MNVYDFDGTVRRGDTTRDFWKFEVRRHPKVLLDLPRFVWVYFLHLLGKRTLTEAKSAFFSFFRRIDAEKEAELFRQKNEGCLDTWYLAQTQKSDIIITASPVWLVSVLCRGLGVTVLGTEVDKKTGILLSENCRGEEKIRRLRAQCGEEAAAGIDCFYSDSHHDDPLARLAKQAFLVRKDCSRVPWEFRSREK